MIKTEYAEKYSIESVETEAFEGIESENLCIMNSNYYYVYEHYLDGNVIYVGKGKGYRAYSNLRNPYWELTVGDRSNEVEVKIIGMFKVEDDAFLFEELLIRKRINEGCKLCNVIHNDKIHENFDESEVNLIREKRDAARRIRRAKEKAMRETLRRESYNIKNDRELLLNISKDFIGRRLTAAEKEDLCMTIGLRNRNGRVYKWRTISKLFLEQGFTIKDETVRINNKRVRVSTIINTMETTEQTQTVGEIRSSMDILVCGDDKREVSINVPDEYIGKQLTASNKSKLCEEIDLRNKNGRLYKWRTISKILLKQGFIIKDETIRIKNKRVRVSTINRR